MRLPRLWLQPARPGQGGVVARLIRASLGARLRRLTIWQSPRARRYVEALLRGSCPAEGAAFYLLWRRREALGLAAFRRLEGEAFLNHLYVAPGLRGRGWGTVLLAGAAQDYLTRNGLERAALDVFAGGDAEVWYARLGFVERERRTWLTSSPRRTPGSGVRVARPENWGQAQRQHRNWGFSWLLVRARAGLQQVGRLYAPYFRLADPAAADDPELRALLQALDPGRRLLLISTAGSRRGWRLAAASRRLVCPAAPLLDRLARRARSVA